MSVLRGLLGMGRRMQATTFTSTVQVKRAGPKVMNPATGMLEPSWTTIYDGPAEVKFNDTRPRDTDAVGQRLSEQQPIVKFPVTGEHAAAAALIRVDDQGTVTASTEDDALIGVTFRVTGMHWQSNATSRRIPVEVQSHA